jgi:aldehyde:ferredoxin oxidoreductase
VAEVEVPAEVSRGRANRLLRVDLGSGSARAEPVAESVSARWIGAKGLGAYYLAKELPPSTDPLSPESLLIFASGPYQGTGISSAGRMAVITKSPLTGIFLDSYIGGDIGHAVKRAGYDLLLFEGAAEKPVYLDIRNDAVEVKDAAHLWGKTTHDTERALKKTAGPKAEVVSIGPAGEHLVKFASPITRFRRAAGRGGSGAVMGSKNLKAVLVEGTLPFAPADPEKLKEGTLGAIKQVKEDRSKGDTFLVYGTSQTPTYSSKIDRLPTRNYQSAEFEQAGEIVGEKFHAQFKMEGSACCGPCVIACEGRTDGASRGDVRTERPEYETIALLGSNLGIADREAIMDANERCNALGLDTISTGGAIGFAIECSQRGVVHEKLAFGDRAVPDRLIEDIAHRRGLGDTLAEGVRGAAQILGGESYKWAVHGKGLEIPAWDPRGKLGAGLAYATGDIGGSHMRDEFVSKKTPAEPALPIVPDLVAGQDWLAVRDSLILCAFATDYTGDDRMVELYGAITGEAASKADLAARGHAVWDLTRAFNVREGVRRKDDTLSWRHLNDPLPSGRAKGAVSFVSEADRQACLDKYYELRGWDEDGVPTRETLRRAGVPISV